MGGLHLVMSAKAHPATGERVRRAYRVRLIGTDTSGVAFEDEVCTELVTHDGALVVSPRSLAAGAAAFVRRDNKLVQAKMLGQVGLCGDEYLYGLIFVGAWEGNFWDIAVGFEEQSCIEKSLQCSRCGRHEDAALHDIEMVVFESMRGVYRRCATCSEETLWVEPDIPGEANLVTGSAAYELVPPHDTPKALTINRRKHTRIAMKNVRACLHREGCADDVVKVIDLSRGGIRFLSAVDYVPGTEVSVSVPYTPDGSNVFSKAKVVRVQKRPRDGVMGEFGLQYLK